MPAVELRKALTAFLGEDRFRKFIAAGLPLRYWQEREWQRFCSAHPEFAVDRAEMEAAIRICHVHGDELQPDEAELFNGCFDYGQEYIETRNRLFPHAATEPVPTEGMPTQRNALASSFGIVSRVVPLKRSGGIRLED